MADEQSPEHRFQSRQPAWRKISLDHGHLQRSDPLYATQQYHTLDPCQLKLVVPGFEIMEELGRGAFGVVYRARDERLDRLVAIKVALFDDPKMRDRYIKEAKAATLVETPGIVPVLQAGVLEDGQPFVVQRLIDGGTLRKLLSERGPLTLHHACSLMIEIARVIAQAHALGLVHRDLKPDNILIDSAHRPWIADFGLAILETDQRRHRGERAGTPLYMSPEQLRGKAEWLDGRADIYALGIILYEMLTGRPPFHATTMYELEEQILHRDPKPISQRSPHIPEEMDIVFQNCCAKKINERYASAQGLIEDLETVLEEFSVDNPRHAEPGKSKRAGSIALRSSHQAGQSTRRDTVHSTIRESAHTKQILQYSLAISLLAISSGLLWTTWEKTSNKTAADVDRSDTSSTLQRPDIELGSDSPASRHAPRETISTGNTTVTKEETNPPTSLSEPNDVISQVAAAQERAVRFFHEHVAVHGGYVSQVTSDLKWREGDGDAQQTTVWVQPPATPDVGLAFLEAYERTGDDYLLAAARDAAECLRKGQLHSGGWQGHIDFDTIVRSLVAYRSDGPKQPEADNWSSLDDDHTQSAVRFLMKMDDVLKFRDQYIHEAVTYALSALVRNQFPNGAWAQGFDDLDRSREYPDVAANYPDDWPRTYPNESFQRYYTLNDKAVVATMELMWLASEIYGKQEYRDSALKAADFLLRAQMPDPQPAWAQQYNYDMQPAWGRDFEPPAISTADSQDVIAGLMDMTMATGNKKYLEPLPRAFAYFEKVRLPNGRMATLYELRTDRQLFVTDRLELTYDPTLPRFPYGYEGTSSVIKRLRNRYDQLVKLTEAELKELRDEEQIQNAQSTPDPRAIHSILSKQDERGAWVEPGKLQFIKVVPAEQPMILTETFIHNLDKLSRFLAASRRQPHVTK